MTEAGDTGGLVPVRLFGVPLPLWAQADEHADGLLREFALIAGGETRGRASRFPRQLLDLVDEVEQDYAALTMEQQSRLVEAARQGRDTIDLEYRVPAGIAAACVRLEQALDAADRYCREGEYLLSLATPPDALAFRRWYLGEFVRQVAGQPPRSWPEWSAGRRTPTSGAGAR